jgi:hypothetical protein
VVSYIRVRRCTASAWKQNAKENLCVYEGRNEQFSISRNDKHCNLCRSSGVVRIVKYRRQRRAGHVVYGI